MADTTNTIMYLVVQLRNEALNAFGPLNLNK